MCLRTTRLLISATQCYSSRYIDRETRQQWPEATPLTYATAETVVRAFLLNWVAKYGAPKTVTTDCGVQFESSLFHSLSPIRKRFSRAISSSLMARNGGADRIDGRNLLNP